MFLEIRAQSYDAQHRQYSCTTSTGCCRVDCKPIVPVLRPAEPQHQEGMLWERQLESCPIGQLGDVSQWRRTGEGRGGQNWMKGGRPEGRIEPGKGEGMVAGTERSTQASLVMQPLNSRGRSKEIGSTFIA